MLPIVFALLAAAGALIAGRRNPLYTTRSFVRIVIYVVLSVAAVVGLAIGAVSLVVNRSRLVAGITVGLVVIISTLSLIFIIQSVATPKEGRLETKLPPAAKLVNIHRQKVYMWGKRFAVVVAVLGILALVLPGNWPYMIYAFGTITLMLGFVMLPVGYFTALKSDRSLSAMMYAPWVHWQYSPEDWKNWIEVQAARVKAAPPRFILKRDWKKVVWPLAIIAGGVLIFSPGTMVLKVLYILGCIAVLLGLAVLGSRDSQRAPETLRATLLKAAPEAYFGHDGLYCNGTYTTWLALDVYLKSACVDQTPPRSLCFSFEKYVPNPYGGNSTMIVNQIVPIPAGGENDCARLQQELTARCPKARINLC